MSRAIHIKVRTLHPSGKIFANTYKFRNTTQKTTKPIMKLHKLSQILSFAGLLLPSFAAPSLLTVGDDTIKIAVGSFSGAALQRLADYAKNPEGSRTQVTVICTLSSFHLGQVCSKITSNHENKSWQAPDKIEFTQVELRANWPPMSSTLSAPRGDLFGRDISLVASIAASTNSLDTSSCWGIVISEAGELSWMSVNIKLD